MLGANSRAGGGEDVSGLHVTSYVRDANTCSQEDANVVVMDSGADGRIVPRSQLIDYALQGDELEHLNLLDFLVDTYDESIPTKYREVIESRHVDVSTRGRPVNDRARYLTTHPQVHRLWRVTRTKGHNTLPNVIGSFFCRNDDPKTYPFYCASMLVLLKPWRCLTNDLKEAEESWDAAFDAFLTGMGRCHHATLANIQYIHTCEAAAARDRGAKGQGDQGTYDSSLAIGDTYVLRRSANDINSPTDDDSASQLGESLEASVPAQDPPGPSYAALREIMHREIAVDIGRQVGIFDKQSASWSIAAGETVRKANDDDVQRLAAWSDQMQRDVDTQHDTSVTAPGTSEATRHYPPTVCPIPGAVQDDSTTLPGCEANGTPIESPLDAVDVSSLTPDQFRAYDIIQRHLTLTLQGNAPAALRMVVYGEGGTGKSVVIQTVTELFKSRMVPHLLLKAAFTGIAASLVSGYTTHYIGQLNLRNTDTMSEDTKKRLRLIWRHAAYLIIDEYSMLSKSFLARLSRAIGLGVSDDCTQSFGGINVILCGDLHQFPPVATSPYEVLFEPTRDQDTPDQKIGRAIYEEFDTVVILTEQWRVKDAVWHDFLRHLRVGDVQQQHIDMLRGQVFRPGVLDDQEKSRGAWKSAPLVTPRHGVRLQWNDAAARKWCQDSGQRLFVCHARDQI